VGLDQLVPSDQRSRKVDRLIDFSFHPRSDDAVKTLKGLTPYEFICRAWTKEAERFTLNPLQQMPGLNIRMPRQWPDLRSTQSACPRRCHRPPVQVRSKRVMREIEVNVVCRWYLRLNLTDKVFDAWTLRHQDNSIAQSIFDHIVEQAIRTGRVDSTVPPYPNSTHLKANGNKRKMTWPLSLSPVVDYWAEIDRAIDAERARYASPSRRPASRQPMCKQILT
jgi:hypothetical protein